MPLASVVKGIPVGFGDVYFKFGQLSDNLIYLLLSAIISNLLFRDGREPRLDTFGQS